MKKYTLFFWISITCICSAGFVGCEANHREFIQISEEELSTLLQAKEDAVIFFIQELCKGCGPVKEDLLSIAAETDIDIYSFELETQSAKEMLFQYGLNQVPAIIKIANDQVEVYKGVLSKENIERLLSTDNIEYDRFDSIVEITCDEFQDKINSNTDFFACFSRSSCSDCQNFSKVLHQYLLENPDSGVYVVDIEEAKSSLSESEYEQLLDAYRIQWVPHILHIKNGVKLSSYEYPEMDFRENINNDSPTSEAALAFYAWFDNELK